MLGRELREVLIGPDAELGGLRVGCVELYDDGVVVRWSSVEPDAFGVEVMLSDDVGTDYESLGRGAGGGGPRCRTRGEMTFAPAAPAEATCLMLEHGGRRAKLELRM